MSCDICRANCGAAADLEIHIRGKKHQRKVTAHKPPVVTGPAPVGGAEAGVSCVICQKIIGGGEDGWKGHTKGKSHKAKAAKIPNYVKPSYTDLPKIRKQPQPNPAPINPGAVTYLPCVPCGKMIPPPSWEAHVRSSAHLAKTAPLSRRCDHCSRTILQQDWQVHITSAEHLARPIQTGQTLHRSSRIAQVADRDSGLSDHNARWCSDCHITINFIYWQTHIQGALHQNNVAGRSNLHSRLFSADLHAPAQVQPQTLLSSLNPQTQKSKTGRLRKAWSRKGRGVLIPGVAPPHLQVIPWVKKIGPFPIPEDIESVFSSEIPQFRKELDEISKIIPASPSLSSYEQYWRTLLFVEEIQMRDDLSRYDMDSVKLTRHGLYYHLEVPGLAEKRPSVLVGDTFSVKIQGASAKSPLYEGHVHYVYQKEVGLRFDKRFQPQGNQVFDVEFQLNRMTVRRMHDALLMPMNRGERRRVLFPETTRFDTVPRITAGLTQPLKYWIVNTFILNNPQQLSAVSAITNRPAGSPPLIIWGPPGTGKTITAVEGIRQILLQDPNARILACAPSNSAADLIAQRLLDLGKGALFRLNAPSRPRSLLPPELVPFTCTVQLGSKYPTDSIFYKNGADGHEVFSCPKKDVIMKFSVIVSTCNLGGVPYGIGIPPGHFTHIFIDEAGQALETEIMIPIRTMLVAQTNLILFGDPKQLGPMVHSPIAKRLGFGTSYLERLVSLPAYDLASTGPGVSIVRLTKNFRSHPSILKFPSDEFYDGEVQPFGRPDVINSLVKWKGLPKKGFPIIFHAIKGENLQEATSPSYFNPQEASLVKDYVDKLRGIGLSHSDVGIIAPYRAQCQKIRKTLQSNKPSAGNYKVGSVEEFQGQERKAIIVSTVRTDQALASNFDKKHSLGFVAQERRFNVAVTRAQALLILVGDPGVLGLDRVWWAFMNYVYLNGGWRGAPIEWDPYGEFNPDRPPARGTNGLPDDDADYPPPADLTWAQRRE